MIPRSYSRDLALQLNFIYDAAQAMRENGLKETDANHDIPHRPTGLIWICRLVADTQVSFNTGAFFIFLCRSLQLWQRRFQQYFLYYRDLRFFSTSVR